MRLSLVRVLRWAERLSVPFFRGFFFQTRYRFCFWGQGCLISALFGIKGFPNGLLTVSVGYHLALWIKGMNDMACG